MVVQGLKNIISGQPNFPGLELKFELVVDLIPMFIRGSLMSLFFSHQSISSLPGPSFEGTAF